MSVCVCVCDYESVFVCVLCMRHVGQVISGEV